MSNEIQSSDSAPYVGPTDTELYKLQYSITKSKVFINQTYEI